MQTKYHLLRGAVCVLLTLALLFGSAVPAFAEEADGKNETPVIFVAGFVSTDTVDQETGEALFPPTSKTIRKAVKDAVKPVLKSALHGEFRGLDYPLNKAALSLLDGIRCDENGDPISERTGTAYRRPTPEQVRATYHEDVGYTAADSIYYSYDWRLDMHTLADQLHDFIEYVLECTGAEKVDIIAYSMGTCVTTSYLYTYGREYLDSVVMYLGALNGSGACGDPFNNHLGMDSESLMAAVNALMRVDVKKEMIAALADILYQEGVLDATVCIAEKVLDRVFDELYKQSMPYVFGRIPGFWAMIPAENYDYVRETFSAGVVTDVFYEKVDYYHEAQAALPETIERLSEEGMKLSIVAKYGYPLAPIVESREAESDFVVELKYTSLDATSGNYNETLPEDYVQQAHTDKNYISPDRKIDASTCAFPERTWFIKNSSHLGTLTGDTSCENGLLQYLVASDVQPTVWDNPDYPQYLSYFDDGTLAPLTAENDWSSLGDYAKKDSIIERFKKIFEDIRRLFELLFSLMKG